MENRKRRVFVAVIACFIICGTVLSMTVAETRAEKSAAKRAESVLTDSAMEQAETVTAKLDGQFRVLKSMAASLFASGEEGLSPDSPEGAAAIEARLDELTEAADLGFSSVHFLLPDGSMATADTSYEVNVSDRVYFKSAMGGEAAIESVTGKRNGLSLLILAVPCRQDGQVRGVIRGVYREEELQKLIASQAYNGDGYSLLVCSHGDVIVNTENECEFAKDENIFDVFSKAAFHQGDSLEKLRSHFMAAESVTLHYDYEGKSRVAVLVPLGSRILPKNDWFIFNIVYEERLAEEVAAGRRDSIEAMSVFAFFAIAALVLLIVMERVYRREERREAEAIRQKEEQFRIVTEQSGKFVMRYDIPSRTAYLSQGEEDGFGGGPTSRDMAEATIRQGYIDASSQEDYRTFFQRIEAGESPVSADILMVRPDGEHRWYKHMSTTIFDKKGSPKTAIISYFDNTEQREREIVYARWQQELESISYDNTALYEWNLTKDVSEGQRGELVSDYSHLPLDTFDARTAYFAETRVFEEDRSMFVSIMNREHLIAMYFNKIYRSSLDYRFIMDDGTLRWRKISAQLAPYPDNGEIKAYMKNQDIHEEKLRELAMLRRVRKDFLTGALNRETFTEGVNSLIARSPDSIHTLFMLDVDGFKQINDALGHEAGDKALRELVRNTDAVLRPGDLVGRVGGDEFMICLPDMPLAAAIEKKAENLCDSMRRRLNGKLTLSVSIGIAMYPRDGKCFEELYRCADAALYHTKKNGKDGYSFYRGDMVVGPDVTEIES